MTVLSTTIRGVLAHKVRVLATGVAVLLGVAFLTGTLVLTDTVRATMRDLYAEVYAGTDALVLGREAFASYRGPQRPRLDASVVDTVAAVEGVAAAEGRVEGYAQLLDRRGRAVGRPDVGTHGASWSGHADLDPFRLMAGRAPAAGDEAVTEVVIDRRSARTAGYGVGDGATVLLESGPRRVTIVGVAAFGHADSPGAAAYVFFPDTVAPRLLGVPGKVDAVAVAAEPGVSPSRVRDAVAAVLGDGVEVLTGAQVTAESQARSAGITRAVGTFLGAFAVIALFVAAFIIHNTFTILVAQRGREVALLRAVGASRRQVLGSVLTEAVVVGAVASLLGLVAGTGVAAGLKALLGAFGFDIPAGSLVVMPRTLAAAGLVGVAVTVVSAVLPARRAARIPPVAALRDVATDTSATSRRRIVSGAVLTAFGGAALLTGLLAGGGGVLTVGAGAALVFLGVAALGPVVARPLTRLLGSPLPVLRGVPGTLAVQNAARNPRRTSGAAAALMIGVGLVSFITVFATSAKASLRQTPPARPGAPVPGPDFVVDPRALGVGGLSPTLATRLERLPEVAAVASVRVGTASVEGDGDRDLVAVDPAAYQTVADAGVVEGSLARLDASSIAVSESVARSRGWSVGHRVTVRFAETGEHSLRIAALFTRAPGSYLVALPVYEANVVGQLDTTVLVRIAPGVSAGDAQRAIESVTREYGIPSLQRPADTAAAQEAGIDQMLNMVYVLLALAVLIALLGITNTLSLSVLERTRELGLLRAVGMSRAQLRSMVRYESTLIALLGTVLGMGIGLFFAWTMARAVPEPFDVEVRVPVGHLAVVAVVAAGSALAAAVPPARRAARLDVLAAVNAD